VSNFTLRASLKDCSWVIREREMDGLFEGAPRGGIEALRSRLSELPFTPGEREEALRYLRVGERIAEGLDRMRERCLAVLSRLSTP
jgi:hypothetical protein